MTRSVLVLSPFASWPENAGHRRRVAQTTRLMRDAGFRVTFLLYAFEDAWAHRFDRASYDALRAQWPEIQVFHANAGVGGVPLDGVRHAIDEWWDPGLGAYLDNIFSRRRFDAFVVHNVWLSRAFTHAPKGTVRVLEIHDLFHRRAEIFTRLALRQDFFRPTIESEVEGLSRADIVSSIQPSEHDWVTSILPGRGRLVPYFDPALARHALGRRDYLAPDVVRFGILASGHSLNLHGIRGLVAALRAMPAADGARVRLVIGGAAARFVAPDPLCELMPEVASEAAFYARTDIAVAPNTEGTGFKIKVADALGLGMPLLATRHSAEGIRLAHDAAPTTQELAMRMIAIARTRPALAGLRKSAMATARRLRRDASRGGARLVTDILRLRPVLRVDLVGCTARHGILRLLLELNHAALARSLEHGRPTIHLAPEVADLLSDLMPDGVSLAATSLPERSTDPEAPAAAAFRHIARAGPASLDVLRLPSLRHEPICTRLLWARQQRRKPWRFDSRPILVVGTANPPSAWDIQNGNGSVAAELAAPVAAQSGYALIRSDQPAVLEDLAVALFASADRERISITWAAGESPASRVISWMAARCGHSFVSLGRPGSAAACTG